jgi:hypothetical protein
MKNENIQENAHDSVTAEDPRTENDPLSKPRIQPAKKYAITEKTRLNYLVVVKNLFKYSEKKRSNDGSRPEWFAITPIEIVKDLMERTNLVDSSRMTYT